MGSLRFSHNEQYSEMHQLFAQKNDPEVKDLLILMNMKMVKSIAGRFISCSEPIEDLVQIGIIGLINAIDRYDPNKGTRFSTFAIPTIVGTIKRHIRDTCRNYNALCCISLDTSISDKDGKSQSFIELTGTEDPNIARITDNVELAEAISELDSKSRQIIEFYFFKGLKQKQIADLFGCSRANIFQLKEKALKNLFSILQRDGKHKKESKKPNEITTPTNKLRESTYFPPINEQDIRILNIIWPIITLDKTTRLYHSGICASLGVPKEKVSRRIQTLVRRGILIREDGNYKKGNINVQIKINSSTIEIRPELTITNGQIINLDEIFPSRIPIGKQILNT